MIDSIEEVLHEEEQSAEEKEQQSELLKKYDKGTCENCAYELYKVRYGRDFTLCDRCSRKEKLEDCFELDPCLYLE